MEGIGSGRAIVGAEVTNARTDPREAEPLREPVEHRTGQKVEEHGVDGGCVPKDRIEQAETRGTKMYAPVPNAGKDPGPTRSRRPTDPAWPLGGSGWPEKKEKTFKGVFSLLQFAPGVVCSFDGCTRAQVLP